MFFWQQHPQAAQLQDAGGAGNDVCAAAGFAVGSPVIGAPSITQNHAIAGAGFSVGSPIIGAASFAGGTNDVCAASGFAVGSPAIGSPAITQNHVLTGGGFAVGSPAIGSVSITSAVNTAVTAAGFAVGSPAIGAASITVSNTPLFFNYGKPPDEPIDDPLEVIDAYREAKRAPKSSPRRQEWIATANAYDGNLVADLRKQKSALAREIAKEYKKFLEEEEEIALLLL